MDPYNTVILLLCGYIRFAWSIMLKRTFISQVIIFDTNFCLSTNLFSQFYFSCVTNYLEKKSK